MTDITITVPNDYTEEIGILTGSTFEALMELVDSVFARN